jgi:hypothetical protein
MTGGLFGSEILDTAIGLVFVYLLVALVTSVINEWIAQITKLRAKTLEDGLRNMLNEPKGTATLVKRIYDSPFVNSLSPINKRATTAARPYANDVPNYIPPRQFALAVMDIVFPAGGTSTNIQALRDLVKQVDNPQLETVLLRLIDESNGDLAEIREGVEQWFNDAMERVGGWYKRKLRYITLSVGLLLTVVVNADSVAIAQSLWTAPAVRATVSSAASDVVRNSVGQTPPATGTPIGTELSDINTAVGNLQTSNLPLFWWTASGAWQSLPASVVAWVLKILGLAITTLAVSLGAPFWFDVLNKFMNFRGTGDPPPTQTGHP